MIVEAALATSSEYSVFLLVNVKKRSPDMYKTRAASAAVLEECVPKELRSIAVLFDETLLESWYLGIVDHRYVLLLFDSASYR